jgi:hypothetical protein
MRRFAVLVCSFLCVAGVSGVTTSVSAAEKVLPRTPFITAGDKICQAFNEKLIAAAVAYETHLVAKATGASSRFTKVAKPEQVAEFLAKAGIDGVSDELRQLRFLQPPAEDVAIVDSMLKKAEAALATVKKDPIKAAYNNPFAAASKDFVAYGFLVCGHKIVRPTKA